MAGGKIRLGEWLPSLSFEILPAIYWASKNQRELKFVDQVFELGLWTLDPGRIRANSTASAATAR
jgi:hypothetical protein